MSLIKRLKKGIAEARAEENMAAEVAKQKALIEYLAVIADVDIEEDSANTAEEEA